MKFIYADSLDYVDPGYDFLRDRHAEGRQPYWDDVYAHELMGYAPYDGVLVSRGIVGGSAVSGKYTNAQAMRFRRVGARAFLRMDRPPFEALPLFGDCGAFTYHKADVPPYTPGEMVAFYEDGGFTHGCSVDHIIFEFDETVRGTAGASPEAQRRFDLTLENADLFLREAKQSDHHFTPMGVVQGWSPDSMGEAARRLCAMGYDYLAVGGTVPLKSPQIMAALRSIREAVPADTRLHILGFAKAEEIASFAPFGITSFDTTSPLIRAFKDAKANYYLASPKGGLDYYTAIRVPQATENPKLMQLARKGVLQQEELVRMEGAALRALRAYDREELGLEDTLDAVLAYTVPTTLGDDLKHAPGAKAFKDLRQRYARTLTDRPWKRCACPVCREISIEVMIFRASNRNKRRGIHNLGVFKTLVDSLPDGPFHDEPDLFRHSSAAEPDPHRGELCGDGGSGH